MGVKVGEAVVGGGDVGRIVGRGVVGWSEVVGTSVGTGIGSSVGTARLRVIASSAKSPLNESPPM